MAHHTFGQGGIANPGRDRNLSNLPIEQSSSPIPSPGWPEAVSHRFSFNQWCQELSLWMNVTEPEPITVVPAVALRSSGTANHIGLQLQAAAAQNPVMSAVVGTALQHGLVLGAGGRSSVATRDRCAAAPPVDAIWPAEPRQGHHTAARVFRFRRGHMEGPDGLIARWELLRRDTREEANFDMSYTGYSYIPLSALGIPMQYRPTLLIPLNDHLPTAEPQYMGLLRLLRQQRALQGPQQLDATERSDQAFCSWECRGRIRRAAL